jgi:hypothetical protein
MEFLLDEGAGAKKVKNLLRKHGHNVKSINEGDLRGIKDRPVLQIAVEEGRLIITTDKLFGTIYDGNKYGVIIIDDKHTVTPELAERLVWTIEYISQKPEILNGVTLMLEQSTPYGPWKMYPRGKHVIIEWLSYSVDQVTVTDHIEFVSTPVESKVEED